MSKFIEVQVMKQNTGNWEYSIKCHIEHLNPAYIKRISPNGNCYNVWMEGDDQQYATAVIDEESFKKLKDAR